MSLNVVDIISDVSNVNVLIIITVEDGRIILMMERGVSRRLDYDSIVDHTYNFTITATDNGYPVSHSGSAMVRVSVTNVNDEDPVFMQAVEHILVSEDAMPNTVIHVVQAYDPDGDDVTFGFTGE